MVHNKKFLKVSNKYFAENRKINKKSRIPSVGILRQRQNS